MNAAQGINGNCVETIPRDFPQGWVITATNDTIQKIWRIDIRRCAKLAISNIFWMHSEVVQPNLKSLQLLQVAGQPRNPSFMAMSAWKISNSIHLLGDGALTIAVIVMNTIFAKDGVLLIDEFDTSIHYSVLRTIWSIVSRLAATFNTELIVTTTRESAFRRQAKVYKMRSSLRTLITHGLIASTPKSPRPNTSLMS